MSTVVASERLYSKQRDLPSAPEGSNMSDLLSITESAVRALDRHPAAPFQVPPRVQTTPVLGLYNAFRDYDSDASGSVLGSVDSHSTSAGSVLINSTSNVDVCQEPLVNTNRQSVQISSKDQANAVGTRSKPVRLSAKNLREVPKSEVLGRKGASPGGSSGCSIHLVKPSGVKVVPEKSVKSQLLMGNQMRRLGGEDVDVAHRVDPWMNGSSSTFSFESAEEERRRWMALDESYRHQPTNSGSPRAQDSDGKFDLSSSGKDIRAVLPLRDSGYMTQGIHTIRATEAMGVADAVADMEDSNSTASRESAIVIHGREESDLSSRESECSTQPSIVTVPQTIVNIRSTASAVSSSSAESSGGTSDSERNPSKPFVALKDRFLKFRPVLLKQGTLASEAMLSSKEMSDELHIEQFILNEKQQRLRQDFLDRQTGNAAIRKCVPARIISTASESRDARKVPESAVTVSSAGVPDFVASAAVAAVVATQTIMKSQQQEILDKISELDSKKLMSELSHDERMLEEANRRKLETLEAQLASLTQKRLEELERHLERQEKQQLDVQAQLHAMARRPPSAYDSHYQVHGQRQTDGKLDDGRSWVRFTDGHPSGDLSIIQDMEREKMSVLETPAPRQKRPMPTMYDRTSDRVNEEKKRLSPKDVNRAGNQFLAHVIASHDREMMGRPKTPQSPTRPLTTFDHQFSNLSQNARTGTLPKELNVMKDVSLTPERPPPSPFEPAPLVKYLRRPPMLDTSPYPEIRGFGESRMASLVQYAEAEAVLKNVHVDYDILESNMEMIERSRQDRDIYSTMGHFLHDRPFSDKIQIKRLVGQRINALNKKIEAEVAVELIKQEKLEEAKKFMYPEKDNVGSGKRPSGRLVAGRPKGTGPVMGKFVAPDKENLPKTTKPRAIKKPRPLNPIEDEDLLQKIYGKTLYHKLRSSQKQNGQCSHGSPKSKLPRTPVHIPHVQVKGVEMALARTQTKFTSQPAPPGQYVHGLQGQLIPMAIPLSLHKLDEHVARINELRRRSPKKNMHVTLEMPKQLRPESAMEADFDHVATVMEEEAEEEEQESTMTEEGQVISLPGHTSPPNVYHGPKFPVRIPTMQPSPSSEVLAADIRRTDLLQRQAIDWVEQELMARIISEMYSKRSEERTYVEHTEQRPEQDSSVAEGGSEDGSVHDSVVVDTIGQHGVQLFVDAGHPISGNLVSALIREVLAEKIGSMFGPGGSDVQSSAAATKPQIPSSKPEVIPVTDNYYIPQEHQRSLVPTPEPTPEPSSTHSPVQLDSLPSTPRRTPDAEIKAYPAAVYKQEQEEKSEEEEDVSFPTYEGMSNSESQKADVDEFAGRSHGNVATPDVTPVPSPPPVIRTPSPSTTESIREPTKETKATQADLALPIEVPVVAVPTEEPMAEKADGDLSLKLEKLPPVLPSKSEVSSPEPTSNMSPKDEDSVEPPTEVSTTNNENVSEGQWLITLLSEGEIPDIHLDEALRQRVRQHMINASKLHQSVDEDTFADEIEQDLASEMLLPSEGEIQAPQCRLSDQEVIVKVVTRPKSLATYGLLTSGAVAEGLRVSRSVGELRIGPDFGEVLSHDLDQGILGSNQRKMHDMGISKGSSIDESHVSLALVAYEPRITSGVNSTGINAAMWQRASVQGSAMSEYQFDQASGKVYSNQPSRRVLDKELVPSSANRGPASPVGRTQFDERFGDRVSTTTISIAQMKEGGDSRTVSPPGTIGTSQNRQIMSQPAKQSSERTAGVGTNGTRAGVRGRAQVGAGLVMSTQEAGNRMQGRRPQLTSAEGSRRPKSPPQKSLPSDVMRQSYETDFSQTGSQLTGDFRESRTPDQMNIDTLIQSHDYFNESEFGSTGQSMLDAGTLKGKPAFQSTYSVVKSVDTEQGASARSSFQPELTETMGSEQLSKRLEDSLEGTGASRDSHDFEEGGRSDEMKYQMPVKIPSISTYEEGTESDVSEISLVQQNL